MKTKRLGDVTQKVAADFRARGIVVGGRRPPPTFPLSKTRGARLQRTPKIPYDAFFNMM